MKLPYILREDDPESTGSGDNPTPDKKKTSASRVDVNAEQGKELSALKKKFADYDQKKDTDGKILSGLVADMDELKKKLATPAAPVNTPPPAKLGFFESIGKELEEFWK